MKKALIAAALPFAIAACGGGDAEMESTDSAEPSAGTVTIVTPMDGALINGSTVSVTLSSTVEIVPAGEMTPGTGHHHLYLDEDLTPADVPVPSVPNSIVHMGDASSSFVFENVPSGEHRIIAVVADGAHVPLQPWVVDTVTFTVQNN